MSPAAALAAHMREFENFSDFEKEALYRGICEFLDEEEKNPLNKLFVIDLPDSRPQTPTTSTRALRAVGGGTRRGSEQGRMTAGGEA